MIVGLNVRGDKQKEDRVVEAQINQETVWLDQTMVFNSRDPAH